LFTSYSIKRKEVQKLAEKPQKKPGRILPARFFVLIFVLFFFEGLAVGMVQVYADVDAPCGTLKVLIKHAIPYFARAHALADPAETGFSLRYRIGVACGMRPAHLYRHCMALFIFVV
jgi:hypothetical protein